MKITIAIPNFRGIELLKKNLPHILGSGADEILIIDDGSTDKSLEFLSALKIKNKELKILEHKKNRGFIPSVNELFDKASGEVVVLLNNDVFVEKDFLKPLLKHFQNPDVFAVNLHEEGQGPSIAFWNNGFYEFKKGEEKDEVQKSAWASGGSAAFRKNIWQELEGFDEIFSPFYWEDTDISFRALKSGYEILWEPHSNVKHEHETTIKKLNQRKVNRVRERNQLIFIWKNVSDQKLLQEHGRFLSKRLFTKPGYWVPYLWAKLKSFGIKKAIPISNRTDLEVINYGRS